MTAGKDQKQDRPIEDLLAADAFRNTMVERADSWHHDAPLWYGWAIFDAFLAGLDHARNADDSSLTPTSKKKS